MRSLFYNPEYGNSRKQKDRYLSSDRAKRMGETFIRKELGGEHGKERTKKEEINNEPEVSVGKTKATVEKPERLPEKNEETRKKTCAYHWIENRIGRIIMTPVLVSKKIVFNKRNGKGFRYGTPEVPVIHFWIKD